MRVCVCSVNNPFFQAHTHTTHISCLTNLAPMNAALELLHVQHAPRRKWWHSSRRGRVIPSCRFFITRCAIAAAVAAVQGSRRAPRSIIWSRLITELKLLHQSTARLGNVAPCAIFAKGCYILPHLLSVCSSTLSRSCLLLQEPSSPPIAAAAATKQGHSLDHAMSNHHSAVSAHLYLAHNNPRFQRSNKKNKTK